MYMFVLGELRLQRNCVRTLVGVGVGDEDGLGHAPQEFFFFF